MDDSNLTRGGVAPSALNYNESGSHLVHMTEILTDTWYVTEVSLVKDGLVRSVKVKTHATELVRPIIKVVLQEASVPETNT